jgi:hypothetical protein
MTSSRKREAQVGVFFEHIASARTLSVMTRITLGWRALFSSGGSGSGRRWVSPRGGPFWKSFS